MTRSAFQRLVPTTRLGRLALAACLALPASGARAEPLPAHDRLHALFAAEWALRLKANPLLATATGVHDEDHLLPDVSREALHRQADEARRFLVQLGTIDRDQLSPADRVSDDLFRWQLEQRIEDFAHHGYRFPLTADEGFHISFARLAHEMPLQDTDGYQDYIARMRAFPHYVEQHIALLREALATGWTLPRVVLEGYETTIEAHVVDDVTDSVFWPPFRHFPPGVPEADRERLTEAGRQAITQAVVPGYRRFLAFMTEHYIPGARTSVGASDMPDGGATFYEWRVRHFTTLDTTAGQVHEIGLREVARIRAEMEAIIEELDFEGSFADFLAFLRSDPQFYAKTPGELLREASYLAKKMDGKLPALFGLLPRQPYTVAPVPDAIAPKYTGGRYVPAAIGSTQPGTYWVNTYGLENRPLYVLPALTLHEAVPGHHLQIALNAELEDLPPFRRFEYLSAFGEGWGLYSEWLGIEAGMYTTPYENFGRLTYEMWRACRLVVDTGLHAFGWTRQRAMDYLAANTALSLHEVRTETDRYIAWPGQALSYKMGELTIRRLRREAEAALSSDFDVRAFHDAVLANGSVPLRILEREVRRFIERAKRARPQRRAQPR